MELDLTNQMVMILGSFFWLTIVLWIWPIIDIFRLSRSGYSSPTKWLLLIILFPILGSILFFQVGKASMKRAEGKRKFNPIFNKN